MNVNYKIETIQLFFKDIRAFYLRTPDNEYSHFKAFELFENLFNSAFAQNTTQIMKFFLECIYDFLTRYEEEIFNETLLLIPEDCIIKYNNSDRIAIYIGHIIHHTLPCETNILLGHFLMILNAFRDEDQKVHQAIVQYAEKMKSEESQPDNESSSSSSQNDFEYTNGRLNHIGLINKIGNYAKNINKKIKTEDEAPKDLKKAFKIVKDEILNKESENNIEKLFDDILDPDKGINFESMNLSSLVQEMMGVLNKTQKHHK